MTDTIHFQPNVPQVLCLQDPTGDLDGYNVTYPTSDGKTLVLPRAVAVKLNMLDPQPGEEISITKCRKDREPAEWVIALTAQSERTRAEQEALELARCTLRDPEGQLAKSIEAARASNLRQIPRKTPQHAPTVQGDGTYGPVPQVALGSRKPPVSRVSYRAALRQITGTVLELLETRKEQWESDPRQGLISTLFISACKAGAVVFDFEPEGEK